MNRDYLKGRRCMVWSFMQNARMYEALRDYGDRLDTVGIFTFEVDATGTLSETGTSISSMMTYINKWPHIHWMLTVMNHGTASIFTALRNNTNGAKDKFLTELVRIMEKYPEDIAPVYQPSDIRKNAAEGKISGMLTIEEGGCCKGSIGVLRRMYELGVRMMTLTWNHENELASPNVIPGGGHNIWPCAPNTETGLKEKGFEFLAEMERLHIIADVSHLSDKGFWDIVEHSTRPFAASHSNCRALAPHCRNLTDEMIRALANKGGLVGLNYCSGFLDNQPEEKLCRSTTALMAKHAAHFKQVGGIEIIGLGSDFDGIGGKLEMDDCSKLPLLADALRREGFTEDEVEAIFYRNARRFFEENL